MREYTYFEILELEPDATISEIKRAYRKLAFKCHPDHNAGKGAQKKFRQIIKAYRILSDPVKKEEYEKGVRTAVTDKPYTVLKDCWETVCKKGFQKV
jgi:molecular chaperone DnaJ